MSQSPRKISLATVIAAVAILGTAAVLRIVQEIEVRKPVMAEIAVAGQRYRAEVASDEAKRERGLSGRRSLGPDEAMYFPMPMAAHWPFWMKEMSFPLDIVWIRDGRVVDVSAEVPAPPPGGYPKTVEPIEAADAVLEINAGQAARFGIVPGTAVTINPGP